VESSTNIGILLLGDCYSIVCGLQTASLVSLNVGVDLPVCISRRDSAFHPCVLKILLPYVGLHTCGCYSWSIALVASFFCTHQCT